MPNNTLDRTCRFLRFSGHSELTVQEGSHAKTKAGTKDDTTVLRGFQATAVKLSQMRGVALGGAAESICIHLFMRSRWRKQVCED